MPQFLGPSEAARELGVSTQTLRTWVADGRLVGERTSIGTLVTRESVERLAAMRAQQAPRRGRPPINATRAIGAEDDPPVPSGAA